MQSQQVNIQAAASRILDTDIAQESSNLISNSIRQQASVAIQTQANVLPSTALKLLS